MNASALLALISELYAQVASLSEENTRLTNLMASEQEPTGGPSS